MKESGDSGWPRRPGIVLLKRAPCSRTDPPMDLRGSAPELEGVLGFEASQWKKFVVVGSACV